MDWFILVLSALPVPDDEASLAQRLRRKDAHALTALYDHYGLAVYRFVLRIVKDHAASEDVVQETFSRVWHNAHAIDENAVHIGPWILTIARNLALDHLRSFGVRRLHSDSLLDRLVVTNTLEQSLITEDNARLVAMALKTLNSHQKQVIELAYFGGLSQTEIAQQLNQPLGTVKSWTRTALVHLRSVLQSRMKDIKNV